MAGRFAHLLDDADRARLAATYTAEPGESARDEVVAVQLSFPPRRRATRTWCASRRCSLTSYRCRSILIRRTLIAV
jgi:hypothetical protein